jgi:hypothetical protein
MSEREIDPQAAAIIALPVIYSNSVQVVITQGDAQIRFGQNISYTGGAELKWLVHIVQSMPQMKSFSRILATHVKTYEEKYGAIPEIELQRLDSPAPNSLKSSASSAPEQPFEPTPAAPQESS